jgi:hypothetical protein
MHLFSKPCVQPQDLLEFCWGTTGAVAAARIGDHYWHSRLLSASLLGATILHDFVKGLGSERELVTGKEIPRTVAH